MPNQPNDPPTSSSAKPDPLEGTTYRALRRIGRGASGEVFEAEHSGLGKRFVVKLLREEFKTDPTIIDRLRVEWQALARLDSPNLVQVTDCGVTAAGRPFYVMEYLQGRTLRDEIKERGALPVPEALDVTRQVLDALRVVHAAGLVHRDVKPENVFYAGTTGRRVVKLLDFGIVKVLSGDAGFRAPAKPTEQGVALGTPRYFAPEQASGGVVDARADLYSVGILLYTALAGRGPFDDVRDVVALFSAHMHSQPQAPSVLSPQEVPRALDRIVLRALEKRPEHRFADAEAFLAALDGVAPATTPTPDASASASRAIIAETTTLPTRPLGRAAAALDAPPASPPSPKKWASTEPMPPVPAPGRPGLGKFGTVEMPQITRAASAAAAPPTTPPLRTTADSDELATRSSNAPASSSLTGGAATSRAWFFFGILVAIALATTAFILSRAR